MHQFEVNREGSNATDCWDLAGTQKLAKNQIQLEISTYNKNLKILNEQDFKIVSSSFQRFEANPPPKPSKKNHFDTFDLSKKNSAQPGSENGFHNRLTARLWYFLSIPLNPAGHCC